MEGVQNVGRDNAVSRDKGPVDCMSCAVLVCQSAVISYLRGSLSFRYSLTDWERLRMPRGENNTPLGVANGKSETDRDSPRRRDWHLKIPARDEKMY